jgi:membrane protein
MRDDAGLARRGAVIGYRAARAFVADDCPLLAAAIAYYAFFSIFPLLLVLIALSGLVLARNDLASAILAEAVSYTPVSADLITQNVADIMPTLGATSLVALGGLIWAASALFGAVRRAITIVFHDEERLDFVRRKLVDLGMVVAAGLFLFGSVALTAAFHAARTLEIPLLAMRPLAALDPDVPVGALTFLLSFLLFFTMYRLLAGPRVRWRDATVGAIVAGVGFELAKYAFVWYASSAGRYQVVYGAVGAVVGLLVWTYLSAMIFLFGGEVAAAWNRSARKRRRASASPRKRKAGSPALP